MKRKLSSLHNEQGSSTVAATALMITAVLLTGAILAWVAASNAAMHAASAADLAALAAADTARGLRAGDPCAVARSLAEANGVDLESCAVESGGDSVRVVASVPVGFSSMGIELYAARAKARAGAPPLDAPAP